VTTPTSTIASPSAPIASRGGHHTKAILAIILISYFMILLDNSIVFMAVGLGVLLALCRSLVTLPLVAPRELAARRAAVTTRD
jgi:hypothetical protein